MVTFASWALLPLVQIAALYIIINRLSVQQQEWIVDHARYWRAR